MCVRSECQGRWCWVRHCQIEWLCSSLTSLECRDCCGCVWVANGLRSHEAAIGPAVHGLPGRCSTLVLYCECVCMCCRLYITSPEWQVAAALYWLTAQQTSNAMTVDIAFTPKYYQRCTSTHCLRPPVHPRPLFLQGGIWRHSGRSVGDPGGTAGRARCIQLPSELGPVRPGAVAFSGFRVQQARTRHFQLALMGPASKLSPAPAGDSGFSLCCACCT